MKVLPPPGASTLELVEQAIKRAGFSHTGCADLSAWPVAIHNRPRCLLSTIINVFDVWYIGLVDHCNDPFSRNREKFLGCHPRHLERLKPLLTEIAEIMGIEPEIQLWRT